MSIGRRRFLLGAGLAAGWQLLPAPLRAAGAAQPVWPGEGRIGFDVFYNGMDAPAGHAEHAWTLQRDRYEMSVRLTTVGLMAMLKPFSYVQRSEGRFGPDGFVPEQFSVEQSGRSPETARFDWAAGEAELQRRDKLKQAPIAPGDQDVLSIWHQLPAYDPARPPAGINLVNNKAVTAVALQRLDDETLQLVLGRVSAEHWRLAAADDSLVLDLWLDPARLRLPVRVLLQDRKGQTLDHRARAVHYSSPVGLPGRRT